MASITARGRKEKGRRERLPARKVALTIAGFDPSSGAGVTADLKVFEKHGIYGVSAITALTIQSTQGVRSVEPVSGRVLRETLECLAEDLPLAGVKIGMLGSAEAVREVASFLTRAGIPRDRVVLDPVLVSSSGAALLEPKGIQTLKINLLPVVGWVTPNMGELGALTGSDAYLHSDIPDEAGRVAALAAGLNVVVTGGHIWPPDDFLLMADGAATWFPGSRIDTNSTHGTGCVFSSALLCRLLAGDDPPKAVRGAKNFVRRALKTAVPLGKGKGPVLSG
ncbi:MAG TPA: bifunctional hydroxymethylpyrimidine kinase/phosphomethylpyrimidine kinase [Acidobacteriaceae bacterium]|nr:bifunctional hydroxymethylpyrimidine kinase/phosphomethylpyrimidine kinase [Acidobacteriaceae bacterium]